MNHEKELSNLVGEAVSVIAAGGVVIVPADTVSGIFGNGSGQGRHRVRRCDQGLQARQAVGGGIHQVRQGCGGTKPGVDATIEQCWPSAASVIATRNMTAILDDFSENEAGILGGRMRRTGSFRPLSNADPLPSFRPPGNSPANLKVRRCEGRSSSSAS